MMVGRSDVLLQVTDANPTGEVRMLSGTTPVTQIGVAGIHFRCADRSWRRLEVANVHVVPGADVNLYAPAALFEQHGVRHLFDDVNSLIFTDGVRAPFSQMQGGGFEIELAFDQLPAANRATRPDRAPGVTQQLLWRRLGYPHEAAWRQVPAQLSGTGLPDGAVMRTDLDMPAAVARGRMRALRFCARGVDTMLPAPGSTLYLDFAGPLIPSRLHRFTSYCGIVDAGSGYVGEYACHAQSAAVARQSLDAFITELSNLLGLAHRIKPQVVNCDQGAAFVAREFTEFVESDVQAQLQYSSTYTPQQNSFVERMWGTLFGTARVLLCAAGLDPTFHPWAMQTAKWLHNRLPQPVRGNRSAYYLLSRRLPSVEYLRVFGCLVKLYLPEQVRVGDRHFAERGVPGINLGPSVRSPGSVIYVPSMRKCVVSRHVIFYEEQLPGTPGVQHQWYPTPSSTASRERGGQNEPGDQHNEEEERHTAMVRSLNAGSSLESRDAELAEQVQTLQQQVADRPSSQEGPSAVLEVAPERQNPRADDPSSVHFERTLPTRSTRNPRPNYYDGIGRGRYADPTDATTEQAMANFTLLAEVRPAHPAFAYKASVNGATTVVSTATADLGDVPIPTNYKAAITSPIYGPYWVEAINRELKGLISRKTWEPMAESDLPKGANVMNCHMVFTVKRKSDGTVDKFKCRLVAGGNTQKYGVDFDRVFATVVKLATVRTMLAIACAEDYNLTQIDIRQAYLYAPVDRELYMRVPPGLPRQDAKGRPLVLKLLRSIYGLKQAAKLFNDLLVGFLVKWGFEQSTIDVCMFTYNVPVRKRLLAVIWVDDIVLADNDSNLRAKFVAELSEKFDIEDKGELEWVLGVKVNRKRKERKLELSQAMYIKDTVQRFLGDSAEYGRKFDSPLDERNYKLSPANCPVSGSIEEERMASKHDEYMSMVGAILWIANVTRPELAFAASQLARFVSNPGEAHHAAAVRVLYYLHGSAQRGLVFSATASPLVIYSDSDWSADFSVSGCVCYYRGCVIAWFAKTQKSVSLSSAEAEYYGASLAAKEGMWLRDLLADFGYTQEGPTALKLDSKSAIDMALDPVAFRKTKHILRAANFLRDLVARRVFQPEHVAGTEMVADLATKPLPRAVFQHLMTLLAAACM